MKMIMETKTSDTIRCVSWNVNGLMMRKNILHEYLVTNNIDIALMQEIKCNPSDNISISGYKMFVIPSVESNETRRWNRGIVTYVKNNISSEQTQSISLGENAQSINVECYDKKGKVIVKVQNTYVPAASIEVPITELASEKKPTNCR